MDEVCGTCLHSSDNHVLIATGERPDDGGIRLCPECTCFATWGVHDRPPVYLPTADEIVMLRRQMHDQLDAPSD